MESKNMSWVEGRGWGQGVGAEWETDNKLEYGGTYLQRLK